MVITVLIVRNISINIIWILKDKCMYLFICRKSILCLRTHYSVCLRNVHCSSNTTNITKTTIGTFLHVKQLSMGHIRHWESQPFVSNTPAGNIILSASILFAGTSPSKTPRVLEFFGCPSISTRTFFATSLVCLGAPSV